jgi:tetratricopeptide (TPR) repeat protein
MLNAGEELFDMLADDAKVLPTQTDDHILWCCHAEALDDSGRYEDAVKAYRQALKIKPDYKDAWISLGAVLCDKLEDHEEALECFENALRINYLDDFAWYNRGNVLEQLERNEDALACYDIVLKLNPDDENAWYSRGWLLYQMGELEAAIASYEQSLKLKPYDDLTWYNKACCHAVLGDTELAINSLEQAIKLSPNQYRYSAKTEADFEQIRDHARFVALINS